jgi:hypothetical protein
MTDPYRTPTQQVREPGKFVDIRVAKYGVYGIDEHGIVWYSDRTGLGQNPWRLIRSEGENQ